MQALPHFVGVLGPLRGVRRQQVSDQPGQVGWHGGAIRECYRQRWRTFQQGRRLDSAVTQEGMPPGNQPEQEATQREQV